VAHVPPLEVLSHRTIWSLVFFGCVLIYQYRLAEVWRLLKTPRSLMMVTFAALMISTNWFVFILSIQINMAVEASLGYYIFPLIVVVIGMLAYGERLGRAQWLSVALAVLAVAILTIGLGAAPWVSLIIGVTFALYGLVKKHTGAGPVVSVTAEVLVLAPLAALWLIGVHLGDWQGVVGRSGGVFGHGWRDSLILMASGPLTAGPLILLSYATRRITLATLGLVQYVNPSLQFGCAVLIFAEPFTRWHAIAFPLIWLALAIYSAQSILQERALRKAAVRSGTFSKTPT
jgi:chloramphenicol-sensitive protein RarD